MRIFGKVWNPLELLLAATGVALSLITIFAPKQAKILTAILLAADVTILAVVATVKASRTTYVIPGVKSVVSKLVELANNSSTYVWTVRSHIGEADNEEEYFQALATRVMQGKVEDVRRLIRLNRSRSARAHLHWLIDKLSDQPAIKVRYIIGPGPLFDFASFDGKMTAFGFPQTEAEGFFGAIFSKDPRVIKGLETAFTILWVEATILFNGSSRITDTEKDDLKERIDHKLDSLQDIQKDSQKTR